MCCVWSRLWAVNDSVSVVSIKKNSFISVQISHVILIPVWMYLQHEKLVAHISKNCTHNYSYWCRKWLRATSVKMSMRASIKHTDKKRLNDAVMSKQVFPKEACNIKERNVRLLLLAFNQLIRNNAWMTMINSLVLRCLYWREKKPKSVVDSFLCVPSLMGLHNTFWCNC